MITEAENSLELIRKDTTWTITQADTLIIKDNQIDNLFDRLLAVKQEMLISQKQEKWEKYTKQIIYAYSNQKKEDGNKLSEKLKNLLIQRASG